MADAIETTVGAALAAQEACARLEQQPVTLAAARKIMALSRALAEATKDFAKARDAAAAEHGTPIEGEANRWSLATPEAREAFAAAINGLTAVPATVAAPPLCEADLADVRLTTQEFARLAVLVRD